MSSSAIRLLAVIGLVCALNGLSAETIEHINTWGMLETQVILGTSKSKIGIPFVQRTLDLAFPDDFNIVSNEASTNIVKGIKHTETLSDAECHPNAEIVKGGINQKTATVRITSGRGCALNSLVEFYVDRQQFP